MIENVFDAEELSSLARRKNNEREFRSVRNQEVAENLLEGWEVQRQNKTSTRLSRLKRREDLLEDRVWSLLYGMGFTHLSGEGGALLHLDHKRDDGPTNQIDVVGLDAEIAIAVECKSASAPKRDAKFQEFLAKHGVIRERFANAVNSQFPADHKRVSVLAIFTWDLLLSENDQERAGEQKVALLNENDLHYYEQLVTHLGPAAKYQLFADMLQGRQIHGLRLAVPALETKMGKHTCYSFSITPEYLLKIAYVSHRAKGKARDVNTYQRMIKKSRLKRIREYISENGVFPTNIVVTFLANSMAEEAWRLNQIRARCTNLSAVGDFAGAGRKYRPTEGQDPRIETAVTDTAVARDLSKEFALMSLYGQRTQRAFGKYKKDLNELQAKRKADEAEHLEEARLLFQLADSQGLVYDPKEDGFVFSLRQIRTHAERHHRLLLAKRTEQDYRKRNNLTEITRAAGKVA